MTRKPGTPTPTPEDQPERVDAATASAALSNLAASLDRAASIAAELDDEDTRLSTLRALIMQMRPVREGSAYWERAVIELALDAGIPQRDIGTLSGISVSAINRWNQHRL